MSGSTRRRKFLAAAGGTLTSVLIAGCMGGNSGGSNGSSGSGNNQQTNFPQEEILLVIPYGAGGYDAYTRMVAPYVQQNLPNNVPVQAENRPGASGVTATTQVYNAEPTGYTNMIFNVQSFVRSQILDVGRYQAQKMTALAQIAQNTRCIGVSQNSGIESWDDYVSAVQNENITFGGTGPASGGAIIPAVLGNIGNAYSADKVFNNFVSFEGKGTHATAMKRGDVQVMAGSYSSVLEYVQGGPIKMFMVLTTNDNPPQPTPNSSTFADINIDNPAKIENTITSYRVFVGPPGIPEPRANILRDAFEQAIQNEKFQTEAEKANRLVTYADAESVHDTITTVYQQWNNLSDLLEKTTN